VGQKYGEQIQVVSQHAINFGISNLVAEYELKLKVNVGRSGWGGDYPYMKM